MIKKIIIGVFLFIIAGVVVFSHLLMHKIQAEMQETQLEAPIEIPEAGLVEYQQADFKRPAVVMFYVDWCTYCRGLMPLFAEIAKKYADKFEFVIVNCEKPENQKIVGEFHITQYPSIYIEDRDLDFQYQLSIFSIQSIKSFEKELEKHLKLREKLTK